MFSQISQIPQIILITQRITEKVQRYTEKYFKLSNPLSCLYDPLYNFQVFKLCALNKAKRL
jgi:hypothetical protein